MQALSRMAPRISHRSPKNLNGTDGINRITPQRRRYIDPPCFVTPPLLPCRLPLHCNPSQSQSGCSAIIINSYNEPVDVCRRLGMYLLVRDMNGTRATRPSTSGITTSFCETVVEKPRVPTVELSEFVGRSPFHGNYCTDLHRASPADAEGL